MINQTVPVPGVVSENNEMRFCKTTWDSQHAGSGSVSGNSLTGSLTACAPWGYVFIDGSTVGAVTFNGTVNTKVSISGTYSGTGNKGTFSVTHESV